MDNTELSLDEFLGHSSSSFTKFGRLKDWKKTGFVIVFLHTRASITAKWSHQLPTLVTRKVDGLDTVEVWSRNHVCHESENLLKNQHKRKVDDSREIPPESCGICKLTEWMRFQVLRNGLDWTTPVFEFKGDDPAKNVILNAAGIYNGYKGDLTREELAELKAAGIYRTEAWKQNALAGLDYIFRVVNADDVSSGVQIATETSLLGDKVKLAIHQQMKSLGQDAGNPLKFPYAIRWEYKAAEKVFTNKYEAFRVETHKLTKPVADLIKGSEPPDISSETKKFDPLEIGQMLAQACLIKGVPFEDFFKAGSGKASTPQAKPTAQTPRPAPQPAPAPPEEELAACDGCGTPIPLTVAVCPHCGHKYEVTPEAEEPPPPPPVKTRSQLAAEKKAASASGRAHDASFVTKPEPAFTGALESEDNSDIPFLLKR